MKIDVRNPIVDYDGRPIPSQDGTSQSLREYFSILLNNTLPNEVQTPEDKNKAYQLSLKLYAASTVDFTPDDKTYLKDRAWLLYGPLVAGRLTDILFGEDNTPNHKLTSTVDDTVVKNTDSYDF